MRRMYVQQHRDYGASWIDEDTHEEIGDVSDTDVVVPLENVRELEAERDRLRQALELAVVELEHANCRDNREHTLCLRCKALDVARAALAQGGQDD